MFLSFIDTTRNNLCEENLIIFNGTTYSRKRLHITLANLFHEITGINEITEIDVLKMVSWVELFFKSFHEITLHLGLVAMSLQTITQLFCIVPSCDDHFWTVSC